MASMLKGIQKTRRDGCVNLAWRFEVLLDRLHRQSRSQIRNCPLLNGVYHFVPFIKHDHNEL